jgi:hypothetical protein
MTRQRNDDEDRGADRLGGSTSRSSLESRSTGARCGFMIPEHEEVRFGVRCADDR